MRGEHDVEELNCLVHAGSSPHAWGTLGHVGYVRFVARFIPTCVGNTTCGPAIMGPAAVHPHMRGEHAILTDQNHAAYGSSPHAWGTLASGAKTLNQTRF